MEPSLGEGPEIETPPREQRYTSDAPMGSRSGSLSREIRIVRFDDRKSTGEISRSASKRSEAGSPRTEEQRKVSLGSRQGSLYPGAEIACGWDQGLEVGRGSPRTEEQRKVSLGSRQGSLYPGTEIPCGWGPGNGHATDSPRTEEQRKVTLGSRQGSLYPRGNGCL